ncbi:hypothetical protein CAMRE0001_1747 [Campylobacter rectus RM3267]|uniref:Uncharacterized protein n=1 Tax=Campylobacter rectus RM3267 TaxID=553218 RepID=B9CYD0_CAMRE|nr:hypothetical protein CAMRE0001_1747 [Campylobacter rectus RM3267]
MKFWAVKFGKFGCGALKIYCESKVNSSDFKAAYFTLAC